MTARLRELRARARALRAQWWRAFYRVDRAVDTLTGAMLPGRQVRRQWERDYGRAERLFARMERAEAAWAEARPTWSNRVLPPPTAEQIMESMRVAADKTRGHDAAVVAAARAAVKKARGG